MTIQSATVKAHPNIAFIKYWGDRNSALHIPAGPSFSMNLAGLTTHTRVTFDGNLVSDQLDLNRKPASGAQLDRVVSMLNRVRKLAELNIYARVESVNNFPAGAGIASSASAFAALALAASVAAGLHLSERDLSRLARTGSGSACRSIPGGFVEWQCGSDDSDSYAFSVAPPEHWDLVDLIAIVSEGHKPVGSTEGHALAPTSPLQNARLEGGPARLEQCRQAVLQRDFEALAQVMEYDSNLMHAVMLTSSPSLLYWLPPTVELMHLVVEMRSAGLPAAFTIDAGPNVHVITLAQYADQVRLQLEQIEGVTDVLSAAPGGPAHLAADSVI
jgi:diphosphomevalonate decarboxylase